MFFLTGILSQLDKENGNTLWQDAARAELDQICNYDNFCDMGVGVNMDTEHHKINVPN